MEVGVTPSTSPVTFGGGGGGGVCGGAGKATLSEALATPTIGVCLCHRLVLNGASFLLPVASGAMEMGVTPSILPVTS